MWTKITHTIKGFRNEHKKWEKILKTTQQCFARRWAAIIWRRGQVNCFRENKNTHHAKTSRTLRNEPEPNLSLNFWIGLDTPNFNFHVPFQFGVPMGIGNKRFFGWHFQIGSEVRETSHKKAIESFDKPPKSFESISELIPISRLVESYLSLALTAVWAAETKASFDILWHIASEKGKV